MKRILSLVLAVMMLLSIGSYAMAAEEPTVIRFAYNAYDASITALSACIDAANLVLQQQGKNIVIEGVQVPANDWNDYYTKIVTQIAAGTGPDIGLIAESFMPECIARASPWTSLIIWIASTWRLLRGRVPERGVSERSLLRSACVDLLHADLLQQRSFRREGRARPQP
jgi:hypothetical protein